MFFLEAYVLVMVFGARGLTGSSLLEKSAWKVLEEVCEHLRSFTKETKELNARYHKLLSDIDKDSPQAAIIRSLLDN
ncbi:hypothetical protein HanRHA438_Chr16g0744271 [Helianthus annuus]|uniref:Basic helix-loop-helix leucine zipper transcription factor n=1 Tax=Helianthus annuus TaxID=4232 RepID=A0A251S192_HELAN|nr:putative basic helix-loop-helix leucine zipper transcription factor [Helianthus annuus]KAJ0436974.1 putative transcription factor PRE [Helianthus annuus]KAJ0441285.1 hypothetical protein HanIR_Chr16g0795951 [Helianthus annuus]KAJ0459286.1 putative transcription factor PRE [Helianthus annuus]KAJ0639838.1 putative transcription factor PRE [Helianthus annuus]